MAEFLDIPRLTTPRLLLREWREEDKGPFAEINADPLVMEFFPKPLSRAESDALVERIQLHFREHGFGAWAVEETAGGRFIGFIGLAIPTFQTAFTPCVEIAWRLDRRFWGQGLATEGARRALSFGFESLRLAEIVSFTSLDNLRSRKVMERLGMKHDPRDDFDHPELPVGHPLRRHVLFRIRDWEFKETHP